MTPDSKTPPETSALSITVDGDGVATIVFDVPGEPVNTLKATFADEFTQLVERLEADDSIRAAVFTSGKKDGFVAGADVSMLQKVKNAADAQHVSITGQRAMNRIAELKKPIVAAIHGACLGGGLELALACHARVASDGRKTKLGLPEVQLGLLPGAGGTQRLPQLIGLQASLDLMLTGKQVDARKAARLGLVDEVVPEPLLTQVAHKLALELASSPASDPSNMDKLAAAVRQLGSTDELQERLLADTQVGRKIVFDQARKQTLGKTHGNYPAPLKILDVVRTGLADGFERGLDAEARAFGELVVSPEAASLMSIFFATTALKKDKGTDAEDAEARPVGKVGVIGAGLMGAGIAYVDAAIAKIETRLKDRDDDGVRRGLGYVRGILDGRVKRKRMTDRQRLETMARVSPTTDWSGFRDAPVVVEAVFEDLELKQNILREVEKNCADDVIFASNTSSIPISKIAEASAHPETVVGMHYFSPVHKMPLLEVIETDTTAPWVTATCVELGKRQGKTVIVVKDGTGFYTSRILGPYMAEASFILGEGVAVEAIDRALVEFGWPVGPIALLDEVGIDVAHKVSKIAKDAFGDRLGSWQGLEALIADDRLGRKNKRGFYTYGKGKKEVDKSVYDVIGVKPKTKMDPQEIALRCTLQMVNEAAYCYGEGILRSARDGDIGAIFGLGFPPFLGGPFRYADRLGLDHVVRTLEDYAREHGARFTPAPVLVQMAEAGQTFHGDNPARPGVVESAA